MVILWSRLTSFLIMRLIYKYIIVSSFLGIYSCQPYSSTDKETKEEKYQSYLELTFEEKRSPEHATKSFEVLNGMGVVLFAAEPMVTNPTNIAIDARGRVWVCESYNYGLPKEKQTEVGGRIIILEDTDQDGKADQRTVFYQGEDVHIALGICVLGNKVYVTRSPDMLVFTDEDGDDKPDKKEVLFTGMGDPGDHSAHALVFGPDGKYYFNIGNAGVELMDAMGNPISDVAGKRVEAYKEHYIGGMVYRCNFDGSEFEVLGHNFRNNYEVAVDSYGNLWQSDNDDDGNKSVRINYILEYGNYGYRDEMTMDSWYSPRTNMAEEITQRHWHQNDPGVVPNVLITGAGSPAGMMVYEGELLPNEFRGLPIHADAGPNVVRAYQVRKEGAGYQASIQQVVKSHYDQWFRPIDVAAAPDGSIMIADWYDPGVGGAAAADAEKGRIFRVAPNTNTYSVNLPDVSSIDGAIEALKSPNMATRYIAWQKLHQKGDEVEEELRKLYRGSDPIYKARALWLLGKIPGKSKEYVELAIADPNPDIRKLGIRLARQTQVDFYEVARKLINDPAPEVRAEVAIGLHLLPTEEAAEIWAKLAIQYKGTDRWYLEALGIGAENNWDKCLDHWMALARNSWNSTAGRDIVWRSKGSRTPELLVELVKDPNTTSSQRLSYFRAFDFQQVDTKEQALLSLLHLEHPYQAEINSLVLQHIDPEQLEMTAELKTALDETLEMLEGSMEFVNIIRRFQLDTRKEDLLALAENESEHAIGKEAIKVLIDPESLKGSQLVAQRIKEDEQAGIKLIEAMELLGNKTSLDLISAAVMDEQLSMEVRKVAVKGLGKSWWGEDYLMDCVAKEEFKDDLKPIAGSVLFNVYRVNLQEEAAKYLEKPQVSDGSDLLPIRDLIASSGSVAAGEKVFMAQCSTCHVVNGEGVSFGPQLSEIGSKLSKEGLYRAIMFPNEGISHGYHGHMLTLKDGTKVLGIILSENEESLTMKLMGGISNTYSVSQISEKEPYSTSLMPNLTGALNQDQLINLVEYLTSLTSVNI